MLDPSVNWADVADSGASDEYDSDDNLVIILYRDQHACLYVARTHSVSCLKISRS